MILAAVVAFVLLGIAAAILVAIGKHGAGMSGWIVVAMSALVVLGYLGGCSPAPTSWSA